MREDQMFGLKDNKVHCVSHHVRLKLLSR